MSPTLHTSRVVLAMSFAFLLSGCAPLSPTTAVPAESVHAAVMFGSEAEALAAAEAAYLGYLQVTDLILIDGGKNSDRINEFVTPSVSRKEQQAFEQIASTGVIFEGQTSMDSTQLQSYDQNAPLGHKTVSMYVCVDFSQVRTTDATGLEVHLGTRQDRTSLVANFEQSAEATPRLLVSTSDLWEGESIC